MFQPARGNVLAIVHTIEADLHHRVIRSLYCVGQIFSACGNAQHSSAGSVIGVIAAVRPGVKNLHPIHAVGVFNAGDWLARFECAGISA